LHPACSVRDGHGKAATAAACAKFSRNRTVEALVEHFVVGQRRTLRSFSKKVIIAFDSGMDWDLR